MPATARTYTQGPLGVYTRSRGVRLFLKSLFLSTSRAPDWMEERAAPAGKRRCMHITIDGVRLAYDVAGSGEPIVLLHGFPLDRTIWDAQFGVLARTARVVRIDLRGSGESGCGAGPALMETLAGDVYGVLEALDIERAIIAGHSMGGYVALAFFRMYAERVAGLALIASGVAADTPARAIARDAQAQAVIEKGMGALSDAVSNLGAPGFAEAQPEAVERLRTKVLGGNPAGAAAQIIGMKERVDSADLLEDIAVPALIVAGGSDRLLCVEALERTARAIAGCEFVLLPGAGHLPMLEAPEATAAALERLVERCATNSRADSNSARATRV